MHHLNRLSIVLVLAALLLSGCRPIQAPAAEPPAPATPAAEPTQPAPLVPVPGKMEEQSGEITSRALAGNLLGDDATRDFYVLLPPNYNAGTQRYPVVYVLPWGDSYAYSNLPEFQGAMETLLHNGEVREMILVFVDGSNKLGASLFGNSPTIGDYETYLTKELVGAVDAQFRTLATRDSRGLTGCSNGGEPTMRLALKYPDVFSVAAPSGGTYDDTAERNEPLARDLETLDALPETLSDVYRLNMNHAMVAYYIQNAGARASNPDKPPLYFDLPFQIVDGRAEIVPEVSAKIVAQDSAREAQRYMKQPLRLRGILIQHALADVLNPTEIVRSFDQLLTDLGVEHEYVEVDAAHCAFPWEAASLKFMSEHLVFEEP